MNNLFTSSQIFTRLCVSCLPLFYSLSASELVSARPTGPATLCEIWEDGADCPNSVSCDACHTSPPSRDAFGQAIEARLWPDDARPESDEAFAEALSGLLPELEDVDSDGDGVPNRVEWVAGTDPGDETSRPEAPPLDDPCEQGGRNPNFNVCSYDPVYAYRRASIDLCGHSPSWDEISDLKSQDEVNQRERLHILIDRCLKSAHWLGRNGSLWRIAHEKIRPLAELKSGESSGAIPLGDYDADYALFAYVMSGDRDVRDLLLADYFVEMVSEDPPRYEARDQLAEQMVPPARRVGLITTRWFLLINTMFTPVPRTTAAQAYRSYLGLDIAQSEGLIAPEGRELIDYDDKGITAPACASCHTTLDPLSYPFSRYHGIAGPLTGAYAPMRLSGFGPEEGERLSEVPEAGAIFGEPVADLREWASVATESDAFAQKVTLDLWKLLVGHPPRDEAERSEFNVIWRSLRDQHGYRVEQVVHDVIDTFTYGRP